MTQRSFTAFNALLLEIRRVYHVAVARLALVRLTWLTLAAGFALVLADALLGLGGPSRLLLNLLCLVGLVAAVVLTRRFYLRRASLQRYGARVLEDAYPQLGNHLVNAIDFTEKLGDQPEPVTAFLMAEEVRQASDEIAPTLDLRALAPEALPKEKRLLRYLAIAAVVLPAVFFPVFRVVVPRLVMPFADIPPYSPTRFDVSPQDTEVEYAGSIDVMVTTKGRRPRTLGLALESPDGEVLAELPTYETGDGVFVCTLEQLTADVRYYAVIPGGRSRKFLVSVTRQPRIDTARIRFDYPAYTRLEPVTRYLVEGRIAAYQGTKATLYLTSNRPLSGGQLAVNGEQLDFAPTADPHTVIASFSLDQPGPFEAFVVSHDGDRSRETRTGRVEILPDMKPELAIVAPSVHAIATPGANVPLTIEASDDLGVESVRIVRNHNESSDFEKELFRVDSETPPFVNVIETLDLGDLGVQPGDTIEYYVTARDNLPGSPQTAATRTYSLSIISDEQYQAFLRSQRTGEDLRRKYEDYRQALGDLLVEQMRVRREVEKARAAVEKDDALSAEAKAWLTTLQNDQARLAERTSQLAETFEQEAERDPLYDVEEDIKDSLRDYAERLREAARDMEGSEDALAACQGAGNPEESLNRMAESMQRQRAALKRMAGEARDFKERIARATREIEDLYDLMVEAERFKALLAHQESIERQARLFRQKQMLTLEDQVRLKELAEEQASTMEALGLLKQTLLERAGEIEQAYPKVAGDARNIAGQIDGLQIESLMNTAAHAFNNGESVPGHTYALSAYQAMESMVSTCSGMGQQGECERRLRIVMNMNLGNTLQQLANSIGFGTGSGQGVGLTGQGVGTAPSGSTAIGVYGEHPPDALTQQRVAGTGRSDRQADGGWADPSESASSHEAMAVTEKEDLHLEMAGGEEMVMEYQSLIVEYFRRLAGE